MDGNRWKIKRLLVTDNELQETNKMLNQVLQEIETAQSVLNLGDLSRKLGIERSALDGMIQFWVRKGRLKDDKAAEIAVGAVCSSSVCGSFCTGPDNCSFVAKMPKTYSIIPNIDIPKQSKERTLIAICIDPEGQIWSGHFGIALQYAIYDRDGNLVEKYLNPYGAGKGGKYLHHDNPKLIVDLLPECSVFIARRIGSGSKRKMAEKLGIQTVITEEKDPKTALIVYLESAS